MSHRSIDSWKNGMIMKELSLPGLVCAILMIFSSVETFAAPPIFNTVGEEREMNSPLFVTEGSALQFMISAEDPDGDELTYRAENVPPWASFDSTTGVFTGTAPFWSGDYVTRKDQPGISDVTFHVTDGTYTVSKIITIHLIDSGWTPRTMAELVANRPITSGGDVGTPVQLSNVSDDTIWTDYGGGKYLRLIRFGFTSQVPDVPGWEDDWVSTENFAYLPMDPPGVQNAGAVVEGSYSEEFGDTAFSERACAELDIPVLIIDRGWQLGHGSDLMGKYNDKAVETRDPEYLFYVFSAAHFLRAADALVTVIDSMTTWTVSYSDFKVVFTGHSKFGHTCSFAAAAAPDRVSGFMESGAASTDTGACRLLGRLQGANSTKPDAHPNYLGCMMRYYVDPLDLQDEMNPDTRILHVQGTNDDKDTVDEYVPKYVMGVSEKQVELFNRLECVPNLPHTTQSTQHSTCWRMWLAHCFLGRSVSSIDTVYHYVSGSSVVVQALISGTPAAQQIRVWATDQSDLDVSAWDHFIAYPMTRDGDAYRGEIPGTSTAYYVEMADELDGVTGIISSAPTPVNRDYPMLRLAPSSAGNLQATANGQDVDLNWTNPVDKDFAGMAIAFSRSDYPATPLDGTLIYDGADSSFTHTVSSESTLYYAAFSYDTLGDYSAGATARADGNTLVETEPDESLPRRFGLSQNFPNPFNPVTTIGYTIEKEGRVTLDVYNIRGQKVRTLVNGEMSAGNYDVSWDGNDDTGTPVSSGFYYYRLKAGGRSSVRKMFLAE